MKLKNKKTGEIIDLDIANIKAQFGGISVIPEPVKLCGDEYVYHSLAELNEEWEDYEETKEYWFIRDHTSSVGYAPADNNATAKYRKEIVGNYFETKEEAEKAVEKLKAWKRLKDKGFSFHGYDDGYDHDFNSGHIEFYVKNSGDVLDDLDLLFGGEE